ncbi:MAG: FG-GAP repeat protein [Deltaproteobacteria bacterium]|nr:FG-GAP repeat protein [Deltaproteobacteria bacterium]
MDRAEEDVQADEPGDGSAPPPAPTPLVPQNGSRTGSLWAAPRGTLRPLFRWTWSGDGGPEPTFEVEVDDSCTTPGFRDCAFPSPESRAGGVATTSWCPEADLPVDRRAPVGRRYYWRVRACRGALCSGWSPVRYADVGRVPGDFNGDGFSDVAVAAPGWSRVFLFLGGETPDVVPDLEMVGVATDLFMGAALASPGDLDGDGFGELLISSPDAAGHGRIYLLRGGSPPDPAPDRTLEGEGSDRHLGLALAGAGDVNADGFADWLASRTPSDNPRSSPAEVLLFLGSPRTDIEPDLVLPEDEPGTRLGQCVAGVGDVNGDGYADWVAGRPGRGLDEVPRTPAMLVLLGGPDPDAVVDFVLPTHAAGMEPPHLAAAGGGDLDGDGLSDFVVATVQYTTEYLRAASQLDVYLGAHTLADDPALAIRHDAPEGFGFSGSLAGDVDGDGATELVVGSPAALGSAGAELAGRVEVFGRWTTGRFAADTVLTLSEATPDAALGHSVTATTDINGDGFSDVVAGAPQLFNSGTGHAYVWFGGEGDMTRGPPDLVLSGMLFSDHFGKVVAGFQPPFGGPESPSSRRASIAPALQQRRSCTLGHGGGG